MPYATHDGVRIWYETQGTGVPLMLHPGFAGSLEDWGDAGYTTALRGQYRLILIDPRGQGQSDKPHDPEAYGMGSRVGDALVILDAEGVDRAHFWGYSMGGRLGYALGVSAPNRLHSLTIGAAHPFTAGDESAGNDPLLAGLRRGMANLVQEWETSTQDFWLSPGERQRWLTADAHALAAAWQQRLTEPGLPHDQVAAIEVPTLLYVGTNDAAEPIQRAAKIMKHAQCVSFDGLDHAQTLARSDLVLPHVLRFLQRVRSHAGP